MATRRIRPDEHGDIDLRRSDPRIVWAARAEASSEWSSSYAARTACGPPTIYPEGGDRSPAWLATNDDRAPWIDLSFAKLDATRAILVCETCGAGAVREVRDLASGDVLYRAVPRLIEPSREARLLVIEVEPRAEPLTRIRVEVAPYSLGSEYKEIDAVALSSVPFEDLARPYVPPPTAEELLTRLKGRLVNVSRERPIVHALLSARSKVRASTTATDVQLRLDDGALVELTVGRTTVYGGRVVRRHGAWSEVMRQLPLAASLFEAVAPPADTPVTLELRYLEREIEVEVAGTLTETTTGGFRDRDAAVARKMSVAVIARDALAASRFDSEGLRGFERVGDTPGRPKALAHPLRAWTLGMSVATLVFSGLVVAALVSPDPISIAVSTGFAALHGALTLELMGLWVAIPPLVSTSINDRRVPFAPYLWSYFVMWAVLVVGFFAMILPLSFVSDPRAGLWLAAAIAGGFALARLVLSLRASGSTLRSLIGTMFGAEPFPTVGRRVWLEGTLGDTTIRRTERYAAKAEHLGTDHFTDAKGQRTSHDRFRTWYERHVSVRTEGEVTLFMSDASSVSALGGLRSTDVTLVHEGGGDVREAHWYARFAGAHGAGDPATFFGVVRHAEPGAIALDDAVLVLGPLSHLRARLAIQCLALVGLAVLSLIGVAGAARLVYAMATGG